MANIALGKLPIEKWVNSGVATNGSPIDYDDHNGFASSNWPTTYTLDFEKSNKITAIRFLLWDGLGVNTAIRAARRYQYRLLTSEDNITWITHYETPAMGFNGWQVFEFPGKVTARYVQLDCISNSKNNGFHIVEFEVHTKTFKDLAQGITNHHILGVWKKVDSKLQEVIEKSNEELAGLKTQINKDAEEISEFKKSVFKKDKKFDEVIKKLELSGRSLDFHEQAGKNRIRAIIWLVVTVIAISGFVCFVIWWLSIPDQFADIAKSVTTKLKDIETKNAVVDGKNAVVDGKNAVLETTIMFEFIKALVLKVLLTSIIIYFIIFCTKNYNAQMHNYTVNTHKALAIASALELLDKPELPEGKDKLLLQATQAVFSHQRSGYSGKDGEIPNPNIISSVIENVR